jgi:hypothetical protein
MNMVSECKSYKWESSFLCLLDIILPTAEYMWEHMQLMSEVNHSKRIPKESLHKPVLKSNLVNYASF